MLKEVIISLYLFLFKVIFSVYKFLPLQNKTVFLSSFGDNAFFVAKELAHSKNHSLIFLNQSRCKIDFSTIPTDKKKIYAFETSNLLHTCLSIYHLATSKYVFVDNYVGVLSTIRFRKEVKCVQLWHATGAIKRFGWSDPTTNERSELAKERFQKVYNQFQYIPVGSEQMAQIFAESFQVNQNRFLFTGVPLTDFYYDEIAKKKSLDRVIETYPIILGKKVVLYAPTFRKDSLEKMDLQLEINEFLERLDDNYILLIRLHPSVKALTPIPTHPRVLVVSAYPYLNELLVVSDILISDYSSVPFEFSLLRKKMIFYTYDLDSYDKEQGLWAENSLYFPGPIVKSTTEVINHILDPEIDFEKIDRFKNHWNTFSSGQASKSLISVVYKEKAL
ncbi:CDP-glycerol glycerophosphotransferase family protein [Paenisporosarcina antarctica]|uniref:Teichoic acid biosynthesis protein B n=1 Tax=Paenisporosarcina antarctica TaxID=417367 RepID=A0A4P6ZZU0_9BACL|nr:CDP-glycerol glycerophosphotransferase family protein [Paenisporosarcina antarctica]QBP41834.1 teichoic acid biosynthesis protein B [Paenisporosarcina antarctica]